MKNAQNGFALLQFTSILSFPLNLNMTNHVLGMLMICLSLAALLCDYRIRVNAER
jgi:hypothetical protein